ncbi:hypothetical protein E2C01_102846 [Portunus trituberculatus]|uniref:Uncharacterized protein n=1 Tax=Portunus trituberculatus TaxID=210409 RepID=A0A5B7KQ38_PORTR|nr:hypothetical protein [Portunus trituberculatus]
MTLFVLFVRKRAERFVCAALEVLVGSFFPASFSSVTRLPGLMVACHCERKNLARFYYPLENG